MIERMPGTRVLELAGSPYRMGVVIAKDTITIRLMQRQRVAYAVRYALEGLHAPCLDLDPIARFLVDELTMQVQQRLNTSIRVHDAEYQPLIQCASFGGGVQ